MKSERLDITVDMIICMAIQDYAAEEKINEDEARNRLLSSKAVEVLYDTDNGIWAQGPDSFIELYKQIG